MSIVKGKTSKLVLAVIMSLVVVLAFGTSGCKKGKKEVELTKWKINELLVTLANTSELRYLKISLTLEVESKGDNKPSAHGEGEQEDPEQDKALDVINQTCASKKLEELLSEEGKTKLKDELKEKLNGTLKDSKVHEIYFTYFALQ